MLIRLAPLRSREGLRGLFRQPTALATQLVIHFCPSAAATAARRPDSARNAFLLRVLFATLATPFHERRELAVENLLLRHQPQIALRARPGLSGSKIDHAAIE